MLKGKWTVVYLLKVVAESFFQELRILLEKLQEEVIKNTGWKAPRLPRASAFEVSTIALTKQAQRTFIVCMNRATKFLIFRMLSALSTSDRAFDMIPAAA